MAKRRDWVSGRAKDAVERLRHACHWGRPEEEVAYRDALLSLIGDLETERDAAAGENDRLRTALRLIGAQAEIAAGLADGDGEAGRMGATDAAH